MNIRNPRNGQMDYVLHEDDEKSIIRKVQDLRSAQTAWGQKDISSRVAILGKWLEKINEYEPKITEQLSIDTGRKRISHTEFHGTIGLLQSLMYRAPQLMQYPANRASFTAPSVTIQQKWVPYQVAGVVSPWNFPLLLALIDTIPALLAGCSVILKPSEVTPRFIDPLEQTVLEVPELASVLKIVRGGAEAGKMVVNLADVICFTGSVPTGRKIAKVCAERLIPAFLELGGKDPALVLKDADIEVATDAVLRSCAGATGQACQSLERVYVAEEIYEPFTKRIIEKAKAVTLTTDGKTGQMGPLIFEQQAQKIQDQIDEAIAKGATLHTGGKVQDIGGGLWCEPTVLTDVTHDMSVMNEETFGPVIPIMSFKTEQEAIEKANDSMYGLSGSVFSQSDEHAVAVASQMDVGAVSINDGSLTNKVYDAEKHSFKDSGFYGSRMGDEGFLRFFRKRALLLQSEHPMKMEGFEESKTD